MGERKVALGTRLRLYVQLARLAPALLSATSRGDEEREIQIVAEVDRIHRQLGHE